MPAVITEQDVVAACRETLRQWPQVRAAVLFGSRARGTQRSDSDWDVAIVLEGDEPRHPDLATSVFPREEMPDTLVRIDAWALSEDDLRRRAGVLGTLPYAVCRDGLVLAGNWNRPEPAQMGKEAAVDPQDWTYRMEMVWQKADVAIGLLGRITDANGWRQCAAQCGMLVEATADAAERLVKAAIERRGVSADRSHDIAELAAEFGARRPEESALVEQMAALDGVSHRQYVATYRFRPPEVRDVEAAVTRLSGTLDLWASEIETRDDDMAEQLAELAQIAADQAAAWSSRVHTPVKPKADEPGPAQAAGEAALAGLPALANAIASFRDRVRQVADSPA